MFTQEEVDAVVERGRLPKSVAAKFLNLYVCEADWENYLGRFFHLLKRKHGEEEAKEKARDQISFVILFPAYDTSVRVDTENPSNNLFTWPRFHQAEEKDWFSELQKVMRRDQKISKWRSEVISLGIIDPIDFQPFSRQGFKWLCERAKDAGDLNPESKAKFRTLVSIYGGSVISYLFEKHQSVLKRVPNWRSAYFVERAIYKAYSLEQVLKIKKAELRRTNDKWIKEVGGFDT